MAEWTEQELRASVDAYLLMLTDELAGRAYSKTEVRKQLLAGALRNRSSGSIEYRMQNISSVLRGMKRPWIEGYKPARNVGEATAARIRRHIVELDQRAATDPTNALEGAVPLPERQMKPGNTPPQSPSEPALTLPPGGDRGEEGQRIFQLQAEVERDPKLRKEARRLNVQKYGQITCEACLFGHSDPAMFDVHHPTPLAIGVRTTHAEHLLVLCPTCHRRAHRKSKLDPFTLLELRDWVAAGRP
ncbi:hypothetical protein FMM02_08665 [Sphingomonas xanthus]|uniref:HNH nuclease domain-containing protein n=1 Tax=Sphingomonas xanthus TaxID=2594473 RepID=A0A516IT42_9SPHN|nr:hypothetical protein FMM02_08665 [Sphingomonas xanthus]